MKKITWADFDELVALLKKHSLAPFSVVWIVADVLEGDTLYNRGYYGGASPRASILRTLRYLKGEIKRGAFNRADTMELEPLLRYICKAVTASIKDIPQLMGTPLGDALAAWRFRRGW